MSEADQGLLAQARAEYEAGRFPAALDLFQQAARLDPANVQLHFGLGNTLRNLGRPRDAIAAYDAALVLAPNFAIARFNRATCLLHIGDLEQGFAEFEWRKACPGFSDEARYQLPRPWRGEDLTGRSLYIYPELYQGDLIQFGRYARLAEQAGARVTLGAPSDMHALLQSMSRTLVLIDREAPPPEYDYQSALMTLPAIFGTSLTSIPAGPHYLSAEPSRVLRWRRHIGSEGFRIGIAWQGSVRASDRSFPLKVAVDHLAGLPGVRLISLQKHAGLEQLRDLPPGAVEDLGEAFDNGPDAFLDTAAAISCCDLFITPDTSVVHVGGGLGAPTWLMAPSPSDWRWLENRSDTPWYPSVRIFRQPSRGDWVGAFEQVRAALAGQC